MPNHEPPVLGKIVELNASATLDAGTVGQILDVALAVDEGRSNRFFTIRTGRPRDPAHGGIASVELRVANAGQTSRGEFLLLTLTADAKLSRAEVTQKFGPPPQVEAPTPENSREYSARYVYHFNGQPVSFAVAPGPAEQIVSVAFDRTGGK